MIEAYGLRKHNGTESVFYVESKCKCGYRMFRQYKAGPASFKELLLMLLDEVKKREQLHTSMEAERKTGDAITKAEAEKFIRYLRKKKTSHHDFFVNIGGHPDDLNVEENRPKKEPTRKKRINKRKSSKREPPEKDKKKNE